MILHSMNVNFLAVIVAAAVALFGLGGLWYSKALFGEVWNRESGQGPKAARHPALVFGTSYVLSFIAAWFFAAMLPAEVTLQQATLAVRAGVPLDVLADTIQPFPTFSEIYVAGLKALRAAISEGGAAPV